MYMKKINIDGIPFVTRSQMKEVDRLMIEEFGINLFQMMENAGRNLADLAQYVLDDNLSDKTIAIISRGGSNGGGGLAAARHLINRNASVSIALPVERPEIRMVPAQQLKILEQMDAKIINDFPRGEFDLVIDALIGYGLHGAHRTGGLRNGLP